MSRFNSNKMFDLKDLKANGFTFGGTGLTCMCLYIAWWFSGDYPTWLLPFDIPIFVFWALVCVGTTANWEVTNPNPNPNPNPNQLGGGAPAEPRAVRTN